MTQYDEMAVELRNGQEATILVPQAGRRANLAKAAYGQGVVNYQTDVPLSLLQQKPWQKAAQYLQAYKVGWFYKAESVISFDFATLPKNVEDANDEEIACTCDPDTMSMAAMDPSMASSPLDRLVHLLDRPNPQQTWTVFAQKTCIRYDMAGTAFLYVETDLTGLPSAIYSISPGRMTESRNGAGNIIGWVMDYNGRGGGVPFTAEEIVPWTAGSPDDGVWGVGVVEASLGQLSITGALTQHQLDVLQMGGRLAGMLAPKNRALDEDEYQDVVRAWRNIANDPNAARRLLVMPEPMEWTSGSASPESIDVPNLAVLNRDEILSAFPISAERLGVPTAAGLNSGLTHEVQERNYWQRTIHPRALSFAEMFQLGVVDRFAMSVGQMLTFELEEPDLDDAPALTEKVAAFDALVAAGFDPEESVAAVGLDKIKFIGKPAPVSMGSNMAPAMDPVANATTLMETQGVRQMAAQEKSTKSRERVLESATPRADKSLRSFFREQQGRVVAAISAMPASSKSRQSYLKADPDKWWNDDFENEQLRLALQGTWQEVGRGALQVVADRMNRFVHHKPTIRTAESIIERKGLARVADINANTRDAIAQVLETGVKRGYSIPQLVEGVAAENFPGIVNATLSNGQPAFDEYRAEMIARTETMLAYNEAALGGYSDLGVTEVQAIDGDQDEECADRDGRTFSIEDADGIEDHPNGTLDWIPIVPDKSVHQMSIPQTVINIPPTIVNVPPPQVNVGAPDMTGVTSAVESVRADIKAIDVAPVVNVAAPIVQMPDSIAISSMPDRAHRLVRGRDGKPMGSVETDA